ncbi:hypothetical protein JZ751_025539, partial [Albula glossodonta]
MWAGQENRTAELQCLQCADSDPFIPVQCSHAANFLLGVPANSWVLWLMVQPAAAERRVLSGVGVFELHLTLSGLLFSLSSALALPASQLPSPALLQTMLFFSGLSTCTQPLFQCCLCVERYLAVLRPLTFLRYRPLRYKVPMLAG